MRHLILLSKMMEECGELTQVCSKVLLHGEFASHPETGEVNLDRLKQEMVDVMVVIDLLGKEYEIDKEELLPMFEEKVKKVEGLIFALIALETQEPPSPSDLV